MAQDVPSRAAHARQQASFSAPFGVPLGDLGWFTSLLMSVALGATAFFVATFVAIFALLFTSGATHHAANYALSYRRVGVPVGAVVGLLSLLYLGTLWIKRITRRA